MNSEHEKAFTVARIYFQSNLAETAAKAYIEKRGLSASAVRAFEIGYAPNQWRGLVDHFSSHKIRLAALDAGLFTTAAQSKRLLDFFRDRLMFPIRDHVGDLVGYGGRIIDPESKAPKYLNTPETEFFNKSEILFGLHQNREAIQQSGQAVLVEGYMDVVALYAAGLHCGVAPMGTAITPQQIALLLDHGVKTLWICLDGDDAGARAAERTVSVIMDQYAPELEVKVISLPDGHDPDTLVREHGRDAFDTLMQNAESLPSFIHRICMSSLGDPVSLSIEDKAAYVVNLRPYLENASGALRTILVEQAAELTGLPHDTVAEHMDGDNGDSLIRQWSPHVLLMARALIHDQAEAAVSRFLDTQLSHYGLTTLQELGQCMQRDGAGENVSTMIKFAGLHGPLTELEEQNEVKAAVRWLKQEELTNHLAALKSMPFDSQAKEAIRTTLRMG